MAHPEASSSLVEREAELERLQGLLAEAAGGHGAVVVLEGPAGIGKTTLIAAACDRAEELGVERLSARGGELERDYAYGVVRQLLEQRLLRADPAERATLLDGAAGLAGTLLGLPDVPDPRRQGAILGEDPTASALHGLYWLTANLAARSPLLVAVDDLHWCDSASIRFLAYLARRVGELPILLLAATRPPVEAHAAHLIEALAGDPAVRRLEPRPLSEAGVAEVVRCQLGSGAAGEFSRACHAATGGNPFLVRAVLDAGAEAGLAPTAANAGRLPEVGSRAVERAVGQRIGRLGADSIAVARAVAVLGTNADPRRVTALAEVGEAQAGPAIDALVAAGVLAPGRPLEFVHPIVRTAVHESIPASERSRRHLAAAHLLRADAADAERVAPHLLACDPRGDPWVVEVLREAAARSVDRGAPEAAVRYLARALEEPAEPAVRALLLAELGRAEVRAALPDAGVEHLRRALKETPDPRRRAEMTHDLALGLIAPGRYVEAVEMLAEAAEAARTADPELGRRVEAELICAARLAPETLPLTQERLARLPKRIAGDTRGQRMLLAALAHQRVIDGASAAEAVALARRALDGGLIAEQSGDSGLVIDGVFALIMGGDLDHAEQVIEDALVDARRRGSVIGFARQTCMRAILFLERGSLADAESDARSTIDAAWEPGYRIARMAQAPLVAALVDQGRSDEADAALADAGMDAEIPDSFMHNFVLFARARLHASQGRTDAAIGDLEELARREQRWRGDNPAVFPWRSELALAARRGRDEALAAVGHELALARRVGTAGAIGRALRSLGLVAGREEGVTALRESLQTLDGSPWRLERARTLVELGSALRRSGTRAEAREPLHAGMELAHACGAVPLVERARVELVATGARPRRILRSGVDALTPSERRVAGMAAKGLTNREIAQALFVTMRTVEVHLTHAYQKLDIASREELPPALAEGSAA